MSTDIKTKLADKSCAKNGIVFFEEKFADGTLKERRAHVSPTLALWKTWHMNGRLRSRKYYLGNQLHGAYRLWYENGQLEIRARIINNRLTGIYEAWWEDGQPSCRTHYVDGKRHGWSEYWYRSGKVVRRSYYIDGKCHGRQESGKYPDDGGHLTVAYWSLDKELSEEEYLGRLRALASLVTDEASLREKNLGTIIAEYSDIPICYRK